MVGESTWGVEKSEKAMHVTKKNADNEIGVVVKGYADFLWG